MPLVPPAIDKGFRWATGPGRTACLVLLVLGVFFGGWWLVWRSVGPWLLSREDYFLSVDAIEITPLPPWIHATDVRGEAFLYASLEGGDRLSILDDGLTERIGKAFSLHPWVARVVSVRKRHPAHVTVELEYRRPVCVVQIGEQRAADWIPIDAQGVILPDGDFTPLEKQRYPLLAGIEARPLTAVGARWPDPRVAGAAEIAAALEPAWERLGLDRIVPYASLGGVQANGAGRYGLISQRGTWIYWGVSPVGVAGGEIPAAEKIAKLESYVKEHGSLDGPDGRPQKLDLMRADSIEVGGAPTEIGAALPNRATPR